MLSRTNIVLLILLVAVVAASAVGHVDHSKPNFEIWPDMKYSPAWSAFSENPNFPNGITLQRPVMGTIARGELPLHYTATKEDAARAGEEIQNPYSPDPAESASQPTNTTEELGPAPDSKNKGSADDDEAAIKEKERQAVELAIQASVQRGGEVYRIYCITCHGTSGAGDGPVTKRGFPPPPSLLIGKSRQMKDGQLFHILTYGQGSMAPMSAQLSRDRRWDVINFVRDMQKKAPASVPPPKTNPESENTKET